MPGRFPFSHRAALLAALMVIAALVDLWRHGRNSTRYKEYSFIWLAGFIGCIIGAANDFITCSISPEYFTLGKGLPDGEGFRLRAVVFGLKEGLSAGVIGGAVCVYAARRKSKFAPLGFGKLPGLLWMPVLGAVAAAFLLPPAAGHSDPAGLRPRYEDSALSGQLVRGVAVGQFDLFLEVWWIHTGLYSGLLAGLLCLAVVVQRRRKAGFQQTPHV
jgi:hypothetical protein